MPAKSVSTVLEEIIVQPVAPWIIRIMYTYEGRPNTKDEMTIAMERLFTRNKGLNNLLPICGDGIDSAYKYLIEQELLESREGYYYMTARGGLVGEGLWPIHTDISDELRY